MPKSSREILKTFFETGDTPSSVQFHQLIDSSLNMIDDGLTVEDKNIGLGVSSPKNKLDVPGSLALGNRYAGNEQAPSNSLIVQDRVGIGIAHPKNELDVCGSACIGKTYVQNREAPGNGLIVQGRVGIGTPNPSEALSVDGSIAIREQGGAGFGKLYAREIPTQSMHFDGESAYVDLTDHKDNFQPSGTGSISFWFNPVDGFKQRQVLYFGDPVASTVFAVKLGGVSTDPQAGITVSTHVADQRTLLMYMPEGAQLLSEPRWYHIVITFDEEGYMIFVDGEETPIIVDQTTGQNECFFVEPTENTRFLLAARPSGDEVTSNLSGDLDQFFITERKLDDGEVKNLYKSGRAADTLSLLGEDLKAYWRFDKNDTEELLHDHSLNGHHGIANGIVLVERKRRELYFKDSLGNETLLTTKSEPGLYGSIWDRVGPHAVYTDGHIGVNTNVPATPLHVKERDGHRATVRLESTSGQSKTWDIGSTDDAGKGTLFINKVGTGSDQCVLTITEDGKMGIGTQTPQSTLHVAGNLQLQNGPSVNEISTDSSFSNSSDNKLYTQKAIKDYIMNIASYKYNFAATNYQIRRNDGNVYDNNQRRFKAPEEGFYFFNLAATCRYATSNNFTGSIELRLSLGFTHVLDKVFLDNVSPSSGGFFGGGGVDAFLSGEVLVHLNQNQQVSASAIARTFSSEYSCQITQLDFSGFKHH